MAQTNVQAFSGDVEISSNLEVGTANLFVDTVNSRVGIGTNEPTYKLNVLTDTNYDGISLRDSTRELLKIAKGDNGAYINMFESSVSKVNIATSGVSWLNGGNVGIGTADPDLDLHVMGAIMTQNNGTITPQIQFKSGSNNTNGWLVRANISDTFAGDFTIDRQDNSVTPSKFVIKNGGNVGIGTTNPGQALHIYRSGANNAVIKAEAAGTQEAEIQLYHTGDAAAWGMYMPVNSDSLRFYRNGDRMTLTSGGNVGIGTVSPEGSLHVQGSGE